MIFAPIVTKFVLKCVQRAPSEAASILHLGRTEATASAMGHKGITGHKKARGHKGLRVSRRLRATRGLRSTRGLRATWRLRAARELRTPPVRVWAATRTLPPIRVWAAATWSRGDRVRPTGRPIWAAVLWAAHTAVRPSMRHFIHWDFTARQAKHQEQCGLHLRHRLRVDSGIHRALLFVQGWR